MEKTEWPSAHRLGQLRNQGQFAYSRIAARLFICAALIAAAAALRDTWQTLWTRYRTLFESGLGPGATANWRSVLEAFSTILHGVAWTAAISALVYVLLCSRFLFRLPLFRFDLARFNIFHSTGGEGPIKRIALLTVASLFSLALAAATFFIFSSRIIILLNGDRAYFVGWAQTFFAFPLLLLLVFVLTSAIIAWFFAWRSFMQRNKMSMREIREEGND